VKIKTGWCGIVTLLTLVVVLGEFIRKSSSERLWLQWQSSVIDAQIVA